MENNMRRPCTPEGEKVLDGGDMAATKRPSNFTVHEIVELTITDLTEKSGVRPTGSDAIFYDIVRGGNVRLAKRVLDMLRACRRHEEFRVALGISEVSFVQAPKTSPCASFASTILRLAVLLMLILLYLALTPVWYIIHALATTIYQPRSNPGHGSTELPLIYAVRSKTPEMIRLFLNGGASISQTDSKGNNVYHYIANLSADYPSEAIECHKCLLTALDDVTELGDVIMMQTNGLGLTPFEAIAKYGSLQLFNYIVREDGIFGRAVLCISRDNFRMDISPTNTVGFGPHKILDTADMNSTGHSVTSGDYRDRPGYGQPDNPHRKISLARHRFDVSHYEKGDIHGKQSYILQLLTARDIEGLSPTEVEALSGAKFLKHWMRDKQKMFFRFTILVHVFQIAFTILLLAYLALNAGDGDLYPLRMPASLKDLNTAFKNINMFNQRNSTRNITVYDFAKGTMQGEICPSDYGQFGGQLMDKCQYETFTEIKQDMCTKMSEREILIAIDPEFWDEDDKRQMEKIAQISGITYKLLFAMTVAYLIYDFFFRLLFLVNSYSRSTFCDSRIGVASRILATFRRRIPGSYIKKQLNVTAFCLIVLHEALKKTHNEREVHHNFADPKYKVGNTFDQEAFSKDVESEAEYVESFVDRIRYTVMACLMMRLLALVLSLRVLPSVGFFVITTLKLAKILVNFLVVFSLVALSFASVFHFVMRDPNCQAQKLNGFNTLADSLLQTYTVMLGQGSIVQSQNISATIAYVMYTTITCLLLLNLIIAVMGTMADALNRQPWRENLCLMEHWEQTLGAEADWQTLVYPIRLCSRRGVALYHRLTGTYTYGKPACVEVVYTDDA